MDDPRSWALIPARGGSQRLPRKNLMVWQGQPILVHAIAMARESGCFDRIIVSTDCPGIAKVAREAGAEVPFQRPPQLADNHAGTEAVLAHALRELMESSADPEEVCVLYPATPLLRARWLQRARELLHQPETEAVFPVLEFPSPVQRALLRDGEGFVRMVDEAYLDVRTQDLEARYHDAGQFYWLKVEAFLRTGSMWPRQTRPMLLPRYSCIDIDDREDWSAALRLAGGDKEHGGGPSVAIPRNSADAEASA